MPKLQAPAPPFIPLPEVAVRPVAQSNAIAQVTTVRPADPVPVEPGPVVSSVVAPVIDAAHSCRKPEYPPLSRRMEESGTVVLEFLIDLDGRVAEGRVAQSSGYERLDEAARQALSLCRFRPGMVNGVPEPSWAQLRYTWKLG
jgi:protein TonB